MVKDKQNLTPSAMAFIFFAFISLMMFLGAMHPILTYTALALCLVLSFLFGFYFSRKGNFSVCVGIIVLIVFQNFFLGVGGHIAGNESQSMSYITQMPFVCITMIWLAIKINENKLINKYFAFLLVCILFAFIVARGPLQSILVNTRNMVVFFFAYEIGKKFLIKKSEINKFLEKFFFIAIIVLVVGVFLLIGGYKLYKLIGIHEVYIAKKDPIEYGGLNNRFYTFLIFSTVTRMGSVYYEPVNLGYFFSIAFLVSFFYKWTDNFNKRFFTSILMAVGLILTFGKGGYMVTFLIVASYVLDIAVRTIFGVDRRLGFLISTILIIIIAFIAFYLYYKLVGGTALPHFWGIFGTWNSIKAQPYGYGLGMGGNALRMYGEEVTDAQWLSTGGETGFLCIAYQLGLQGALALTLCYLSTSTVSKFKDKVLILFSYVPLALLIVSFLQENTFTPQCIVPFLMMQGAFKNLSKNNLLYEEK